MTANVPEATVVPSGLEETGEGPPLPGPDLETAAVLSRYEGLVYRIALTHTACRSDADDVYQNVFLTYHRKRPACADEEHLKAWLITTALNCARQVAGSSWRTRVVPLAPEHAGALPARFQFRTELQQAVFWALSQLPESYRTVLFLFYFEDWPAARIGRVLGLEVGAVKMRLSRGRTMMREQLQGDVFDE
ncbi:MAG: sigma-70 family RNA polymerase sigma factor [Bifidobacteriaceae bacterium]|jgi:RNA polymerase sigma-70 factor (ECF subfamily)|nr:sigma-70 family RNA polymerase sigma factor [Bifidobacteriaceae bacterium]